jgi:hypothetical protein
VAKYEHTLASAGQPSPLIRYALRGLKHCWMPEIGRWSHIFHLDGRAQPNESLPSSDVFYSLNVLLGLSRLSGHAEIHDFDMPRIFNACVRQLPRLNSPKYGYGTALWAAAELGFDIPSDGLRDIRAIGENKKLWRSFRAQDLGMILAGYVRAAQYRGGEPWTETAHELFRFLREGYTCPSGLFYDSIVLGRRSFSSFATQTYLTLACFIYGEWSGENRALELAKACARKLIELQGPNGEWPWFFYTPAGQIIDYYEVYSVHQQGMAPAFLEYAERHDVAGAREALVNGFLWILGRNQLNRSMLWTHEGLICRSHARRGELGTKDRRVLRALSNAALGKSDALVDPSRIELRLECRSYELGWILWSFGRRNDLVEIRHHAAFSQQ